VGAHIDPDEANCSRAIRRLLEAKSLLRRQMAEVADLEACGHREGARQARELLAQIEELVRLCLEHRDEIFLEMTGAPLQ